MASQWESVGHRLRDADRWVQWLPGLRSVTKVDASIWMTFSDAQASRFRVEFQHSEHAFKLQMVEGSVRSLEASLRWKADRLRLIIDLDLNSPLPGVLARELEEVYPARLLAALLSE